MALCKRYYQTCIVPTQVALGDSNGQLLLCIPLTTQMRVTPTVSYNSNGIWLHPSTGGNAVEFSGQYAKTIWTGDNMLAIENLNNPNILNNVLYSVNQSNTENNNSSGAAKVFLDAEIY